MCVSAFVRACESFTAVTAPAPICSRRAGKGTVPSPAVLDRCLEVFTITDPVALGEASVSGKREGEVLAGTTPRDTTSRFTI